MYDLHTRCSSYVTGCILMKMLQLLASLNLHFWVSMYEIFKLDQWRRFHYHGVAATVCVAPAGRRRRDPL